MDLVHFIYYLYAKSIVWFTVESCYDVISRFLFAHYNNRFQYPVLVFHRGDVNRSQAYFAFSKQLMPNQLALIELHEAEHIQEYPPGVSLENLAKEPDIVFRHMFLTTSRCAPFGSATSICSLD